MVLDCALEVGSLGVLGGMVVSVMLLGGFAVFFRNRKVNFSQDYMCRVLKNFGDCGICSVSERLWRYFAAMKLCGESTKGGCDFGNFFTKCKCVVVFCFCVFRSLVVRAGEVLCSSDLTGFDEVGMCMFIWSVTDSGRTF